MRGILLITLFLLIMGLKMAFTQFSTNYQIPKQVTNQAGTASQSNNYQIRDAVGQPSPVSFATSNNYIVSSGFWGGGIMLTYVNEKYEAGIPDKFRLSQNYPNPFNPITTIEFDLPKEEEVLIGIYNLAGQKVATLANQRFNAGFHEVKWNASHMASGVYLYRLEAGDFVEIKKMVFMR